MEQLPAADADGKLNSFAPPTPKEAALPPWLSGRRTIGGFYVLHPLGTGGVGSVFVVKRVEERHRDDAVRFALKVPDYSAEAARTLSEDEFLNLFRQEAGALLALPRHENLATFVTFDAGARPKPILVMELVEGPTLERVIERGDLGMRRALSLLDGIGAGLEGMHRLDIGHLDVKPSNVILRSLRRRRAANTSRRCWWTSAWRGGTCGPAARLDRTAHRRSGAPLGREQTRRRRSRVTSTRTPAWPTKR